jgi:hypothetical protein
MAATGPSCPVRCGHLLDVLAWWQAARPVGGVPHRRAIDPRAFPRALPCVWLCDYDPGAGEFRYRLAGEDVNAVFGRPLKGLTLAAAFPSAAGVEAVRATLWRVIAEPAVGHAEGPVYAWLGRQRPGERLILPLLDDAGRRTAVLGATRYHPAASPPGQAYGGPAARTSAQSARPAAESVPATLQERFFPIDTADAWRP